MRLPTTILEGKKISRIILSIQPRPPFNQHRISSLMKIAYEMGIWCFDLPSRNHLESFRELRNLVADDMLIGLCHVEAETGASFLGKPLHRFESKIISTIRKEILPPQQTRNILPPTSSIEIFTQKEIDRVAFDPLRFEKALSAFDPEESSFLLLGERYGDWLLALGRIDLLQEMVSKARGKGFIPIFSGQWATFVLPKAKSLDVSAYAIPVNKKRSLFDLQRASDLIKKFEKPVISLNPFDDGNLLRESQGALSYLFDELKVCAAIAGVGSEEEVRAIIEAVKEFPSLIPPRKT